MDQELDLDKHPAILAFVDIVRQDYDITSDDLVVMQGSVAVVHPENPPYRKVKYVSAFVRHLEEKLVEAGFKCTDHHNYQFEGHGLRAWIENVDVSDPEEADPIEVDFVEI